MAVSIKFKTIYNYSSTGALALKRMGYNVEFLFHLDVANMESEVMKEIGSVLRDLEKGVRLNAGVTSLTELKPNA